MLRFALASLSPIMSLTLACLWGGAWPWIALGHMTLFVVLMDRLAPGPAVAHNTAGNPDAAFWLNLALGVLHFPVLALGVWAIAMAPYLGTGQKLATALALGLFIGQIGNSNAHELIHAPARLARRLGAAVYVSILFGHHVSAHRRVHHVHVASDGDPNTARLGEGFYRFWPRAWAGSFGAGMRAETAARARLAVRPSGVTHPYVAYVGGAVGVLALAFGLSGSAGVLVLLGLAAYAQMQLLLADYIQHYGLRREVRSNGGLEPVGPQHSWNAPHRYSAAMLLNAPRHSDHHLHPSRRFPALELDAQTMPVWPRSMPVMATLALFPALWRRVMDPRARAWLAQERPGPEQTDMEMPRPI